jgi:hypothetical protein
MVMELFSLVDETKAESNGTARIKKAAFKKMAKTTTRNENFANIINNEGWPKQNEALYIKTNGCSDTGSIFWNALETFENIESLYLSTWIISRESIDALCRAVDEEKLSNLYFVVSKRLKELKKSNYNHLVEQFEQRQNIKFKTLNCHAKTFSFNTGKNYFTVIGSGNWTENPRIENYVIINDKAAFEFNKEWMSELL